MSTETLGMRIRAGRLRYGWSSRHCCYVRISYASERTFLVECRPAGLIPSPRREPRREYVIWWEGKGDDAPLLDMIQPLRNVVRLKRPVSFVVDWNGKAKETT